MAQAADAEYHNRRAGLNLWQDLFDGVVGGDSRIGERGERSRVGAWRQFDDCAGTGPEILSVPTIGAIKAREEARARAVHVVASPAVAAQAAAWLGVQDDGVA